MDSIFCCSSIQPYRPQVLSHEAKFAAFLKYMGDTTTIAPADPGTAPTHLSQDGSYVVQVVRQVNFGAIEWKKNFVHAVSGEGAVIFYEVSEIDLIHANFQKLNSYKNFKCRQHNKFFELNIYQRDPVNQHHWRANIARPAGDIDLPTTISSRSNITNTTLIQGEHHEEDINDSVGSRMGETISTESSSVAPTSDDASFATSGLSSGTNNIDDNLIWRARDERDSHEFGDGEYRYSYSDQERDDDSQSEKDFTACSASDCGYCGHCKY